MRQKQAQRVRKSQLSQNIYNKVWNYYSAVFSFNCTLYSQKFLNSTILMFFKEVSSAHKAGIYWSKVAKTVTFWNIFYYLILLIFYLNIF